MFVWVGDPQAWIALTTLTFLEIVLGIDNIIFIVILAGRLPEKRRAYARKLGLLLALGTRLALLAALSVIVKMTNPVITVESIGVALSVRDLILIAGGVFLLAKSTKEIHHRLEGEDSEAGEGSEHSLIKVVAQIAVLDVVFSFDSVVTAVGMVDEIEIMVLAVILSIVFMLIFSGFVSKFVDRHPTVKMLALSFLLLIGLTLIADGLGHHIPKGYIYFAMGFSALVESLNLRARSVKAPKA
ncbi:MAG TPA: TerC family protein [Planctomycetes bacterium]|nr:TerC family protein [Planctomycetota bacterium]